MVFIDMNIANGLIFGVTGHRSLRNIKKLETLLIQELDKLIKTYDFQTIVSPLADGADRLVAKIMMDRYDTKLNVLLPFEVTEYRKDFSSKSKEEFSTLLIQAEIVKEVSSLEGNTRNMCYFKVGIEVVDKCDVLITLWDGKKARSLGGTADIVAYAEKCGKDIIHIHTETYQVDRLF